MHIAAIAATLMILYFPAKFFKIVPPARILVSKSVTDMMNFNCPPPSAQARIAGIAGLARTMLPLLMLVCLAGCNMRANRHNVTGIQAFQTGQISQAINEFQRALTADPQNADALYNLGTSYVTLGKQTKNQTWLEQAEQLFRQAITVNHQHVDAHRGLSALLVETGREQYAFDLLDGWRTRNPGQSEPLIELARLYQEYGDNRRASDLLSDALKLNSNNTRALKALGHVREAQGQYQLALENYLSVVQLDPQQTDVYSRVAALQNHLAKLPAGSPNAPTPARYGSTTPFESR